MKDKRLTKHNLFNTRWCWTVSDIKRVLDTLGPSPGRSLHICSGSSGIGDIRLDRRQIDGRSLHKGFRLIHSGSPNVLGNMLQLPFKSGCFNTVIIDPPYDPAWILNGVYKDMLDEIARVMAPEGRVIIIAQYIFSHRALSLKDHVIYETGADNFYYKVLATYQKENTLLTDY